ncbi:MAG: S9 family peptidase [Opitutales bacterium]|nr:S9 family peptidase [Opitutales bacterium]
MKLKVRAWASSCVKLTVASFLLSAASPLLAQKEDAQYYFSVPDCRDLQLSPDASFISFLHSFEKVPKIRWEICILNPYKGNAIKKVSESEDDDISTYFWANSFYLGMIDSANQLKVINHRFHDPHTMCSRVKQVDFLGMLPGTSDFKAFVHDRDYRVLTFNAQRSKELESELVFDQKDVVILKYLADFDRNIRLILIENKQGERIWFYRISVKADWTPLMLDPNMPVLGLTDDSTRILVASRMLGETKGIYYYNPLTNELGPAFYVDPAFDLDRAELIVDAAGRSVCGVRYQGYKPTTHWFVDQFEQVQGMADGLLPDTVNEIVAFNRERERYIIRAVSDRLPVRYYYLDYSAPYYGEVLSEQANVKQEHTLPVESFEFMTRDGLFLHSYVVGAGGQPKPAVVLLHDGPEERFSWGWAPQAQFLANLGYVVIMPNYRGSSGYGQSISESGRVDVASMLTDIEDAVQWAVDEGYVQPQQVALLGEGFGGYLAAQALLSAPYSYSCGAAYGGIYDLPNYIDAIPQRNQEDIPYWAQMRSTALPPLPVLAEGLQKPFLVAYGTEDKVVDPRQSRSMIDRLDDYDKVYRELSLRGAPHSLGGGAYAVEYYRQVESFLAEHLPLP